MYFQNSDNFDDYGTKVDFSLISPLNVASEKDMNRNKLTIDHRMTYNPQDNLKNDNSCPQTTNKVLFSLFNIIELQL